MAEAVNITLKPQITPEYKYIKACSCDSIGFKNPEDSPWVFIDEKAYFHGKLKIPCVLCLNENEDDLSCNVVMNKCKFENITDDSTVYFIMGQHSCGAIYWTYPWDEGDIECG